MKSRILSLVILAVLFLQIMPAYAHIPSYNPYGELLPYVRYNMNDKSNFNCFTIESFEDKQKICEGKFVNAKGDVYSEDHYDIRIKKEFADKLIAIYERAALSSNKNLCREEINQEFGEFSNVKVGGGNAGYGNILEVWVNECMNSVSQSSIVVPVPKYVKFFDMAIIFISSILAYIYLAFSLRMKNVSSLKAYGLSAVIQIIVLFASFFVAAILQLGREGPAIPPLHDTLFFKNRYLLSLFIVGIAITILVFILARLTLLFFKKSTDPTERRSLALFYTLIFNPFFFPIGPIIGFMNLIYAKRTISKK